MKPVYQHLVEKSAAGMVVVQAAQLATNSTMASINNATETANVKQKSS